MDRLTGVAELLDGPLDDPAALEANLRDLARINRLTGGTRLSERAIGALGGLGGPDHVASILDVGTGAADIPLALLARARVDGRPLAITATDSRPEILAAARRARPAIELATGLEMAIADGRALPYPDAAFDVAHASLVLHHLAPDEAVAFLRELRRVARRGIVVNDLIRGRMFWIAGWLLIHGMAMSRYTRNDGPLSVRRAYTRPELIGLISAAGLEPLAMFGGFAGHRVAFAAR
jgi:SAM-dependent methyltransferase